MEKKFETILANLECDHKKNARSIHKKTVSAIYKTSKIF